METIFVNVKKDTTRGNLFTKEDIERIEKILYKVKFGSVMITIRDGKIAAIEKEEKIRLK